MEVHHPLCIFGGNSTWPNQQDQPQPEEMHWAISYLREDLHDFRNETRTKIHGLHTRLDSQFRWMMTAMIGMTGLLAALIKL